MCIHTLRIYHCWCRDSYIKFSNRCEKALRTDIECPPPFNLNDIQDRERLGDCPDHLLQQEVELLAAGIPNPAYTQTEEGALRRPVEMKVRYSDPNPEGKGNEGEGLGIRTSTTFPRSQREDIANRRSDLILEGGVPIPSPRKLQRSQTSAQSPSKEVPKVPNPFHLLSPKKFQRRSQTSSQNAPLSPSPSSSPAKPLPEVPNPFHLQRSKTAAQPPPKYQPVTAQHLQRANTYTTPSRGAKGKEVAIRDSATIFTAPPSTLYSEPQQPLALDTQLQRSNTSTQRQPASSARAGKPVQVAIRDSRGFFLPPPTAQTSYSEPQQPPPPDPQIQRSSAYSQRSAPLSPPPRRSGNFGRGAEGRWSDPVLYRPVLGSGVEGQENRRSRAFDFDRRKSNRVSFVYQKKDGDGCGGVTALEPKTIQDDPSSLPEAGSWRESGVLRWMGGIGEGREEEE